MHGGHGFIVDLALVLAVAAVISVLFRLVRQPLVLGYLLAGIILGPHVPLPVFADVERVHSLAELGVILLMFSIGLEFSMRRLLQVGPTVGLIALVEISLMLWLGYSVATALGWPFLESVFVGAVVAISSTMIIAKAFAQLGVGGRLSEIVIGVLVIEDLVAVLLITLLTALASGASEPGGLLLATAARLLAFILAIAVVGFLIVPRLFRAIGRWGGSETLLVASVGLCFGLAIVADAVGYSVALGAFLAGTLVAESGLSHQVEPLVAPLKDVFAAVFFVAVGMLLDPSVVVDHWATVIVLVAVVICGKTVGVTLGGLLSGIAPRFAIRSGMSLAQIGEFSFIIAGVGVSTGAVGEALYPTAVAVCVATAFLTPWLMRASDPVARWVERRIPDRLLTFHSLYASWLDQLRTGELSHRPGPQARRLVRLLVVDAGMLALLAIATSLAMDRFAPDVAATLGIPPFAASAIFVAGAVAVAIPLGLGVVRIAHTLGALLATSVLPAALAGRADLAEAPRRAFVVALQIAIALAVGVPLVALTQPFVWGPWGGGILVVVVAILGISFWRRTVDMHDHVRAGAQVILETIAQQASRAAGSRPPAGEATSLQLQLDAVLPAFAHASVVRLADDHPASGHTLADLDLRGQTGATVVAIWRGDDTFVVPPGHTGLAPGDVLALLGSEVQVRAARDALCGPLPTPTTPPGPPTSH